MSILTKSGLLTEYRLLSVNPGDDVFIPISIINMYSPYAEQAADTVTMLTNELAHDGKLAVVGTAINGLPIVQLPPTDEVIG